MDDQSKLELPREPQRHLRLATTERQGDAPSLITQAEPLIDGGHLLDYVRVLYKRRWIAATAFVVVVVSVTLYTFTVTPTFEATTRLLIESDNPNVVNFAEVIDEQGTKADYYQTQYNILQSRGLARKTLEQLKLWENEHFKESASGGWFGSDDALTGDAAAAGETREQSRAIDRFLQGLTVTPIRNSRLVDVKYRLSDAELAAQLVNSMAKNYIEQNLEYKFLASKEASDWLGERLAEQRRQVETAESALQRYREQNDAISVADRENIVVQKLADLNAAVTRAKTERFQKEALYKQLQALAKDGSPLDSFPAILTNSYIQQQKAELSQLQTQYAQLSEKLGDKHPDIIKVRSGIDLVERRLSGEIAKVVESVRGEYQAALAQENSLVGALNQQKGVAMAMNRKAIDYGVLERDVEGSRQMYQSLMQRAKETGVSSELKTSNIRIVDAAERPITPVSPRRALNFTLAILGGAVLAFGLAFFFEYVDSRIKSPDEIRAHLGLPSLGMIPVVDPKVGKGLEPLISNGVPPNFAEAFRALRTNVLFSSAAEGARHLVITSTGPGEGKTMVAANLAIGLAQAGQRVLLIDADMRRPRVHEVFRQKQEPGLSNLMVGHTVPSACIRKSNVQGLWVLTGGRIPPNPAELLGSRRFKDFVHSLSDHFDSVIIDSPPAMAVTDAAIAASIATGVIFVVGSEMTSRHAARTALQQLQNGRCPFLGVVLNRVDLERNAYYYSHYYRREYAQYYVAAR